MIPILLYHSVSDDAPGDFGPYAVTPRRFAQHLDVLLSLGYSTLTIAELVERLSTGAPVAGRTAVITFDDGFGDFSSNAWPELRARGMSATLYVTTGTVGGTSTWLASLGAGHLSMLSQRELVDLVADGCDLGAHSVSHPQLDCLPRAAAGEEIRRSKDMLEQMVSQPVNSFAYPHGYHDRPVRQLVIDAGFTSASAVRNALSHEHDDVFALARVTVLADFDSERINHVLTGRGVPKAKPGERWRTAGWRKVRQWRYRHELERTAA